MEHVNSVFPFLYNQFNISFLNTILLQVLLLSIFRTFYFNIFCRPDINRWTGTFQYPPPTPTAQVLTSHTHKCRVPPGCLLLGTRLWFLKCSEQTKKKKASVSQVSLSKKVFFSLKISLQLLLYPLHPQSGDGRYSSDSSLVIPQSPLRKDISLFGWPPPGSMMPAESVEHTQASVHASRPCLHLLDQPRL